VSKINTMNAKKLIFVLLSCIASYTTQAQCAAQINFQDNPNGPTTFWADSLIGAGNTTTFTWDFGDGTSGSGIQTSHLYNTPPGVTIAYNVCLTLVDSQTNCTFTTCISYTPNGNATNLCTTQISYTQQDSLYTFQTTNVGTAPFGYDWYVDGVLYSNSPTLTLVIDTLDNTNGVAIQVVVVDGNVCTANDYVYITNANQSGCSLYTSFINQDSIYTFVASTIGGSPTSYAWYLDSVLVSSTPIFTTVITANFTTVCLYVTDANGYVCSDCIFLSTNPGGGSNTCQAYFTIFPDSSAGVSGYYYGYNNSTPNQPVVWDFGDGTTSTDPYPTHVYAQPGNYIVCLTIGSPNTLCYDTYCDSSFYVFKTEGGLMSQLTINNPTGIHAISKKSSLNMYPNPTSEVVYFGADFVVERVRVMNLQGQIVLEDNQKTNSINIAQLTAGVYLVEVSNGGQIGHGKLIKK